MAISRKMRVLGPGFPSGMVSVKSVWILELRIAGFSSYPPPPFQVVLAVSYYCDRFISYPLSVLFHFFSLRMRGFKEILFQIPSCIKIRIRVGSILGDAAFFRGGGDVEGSCNLGWNVLKFGV